MLLMLVFLARSTLGEVHGLECQMLLDRLDYLLGGVTEIVDLMPLARPTFRDVGGLNKLRTMSHANGTPHICAHETEQCKTE